MRIIIQCAASKDPSAGTFMTPDGHLVQFVSSPELAPRNPALTHARPDDASGDGRTWRQRLLLYNDDREDSNALGMLPAYRLYRHPVFRELVDRFGLAEVFILSAGWGLIPAGFLTPSYDVTFSTQAAPWTRRRNRDAFADFSLLPDDGRDIIFVGGKAYRPLLYALTARHRGRRSVLYNAASRPELPPGFNGIRYHTAKRTNWHYEAARSLIAGEIAL